MFRKDYVAGGDVFSSFLVVFVSCSLSLGKILLSHAFYTLIFFLATLFMNIKTVSVWLSIQIKAENLPSYVPHRGLASSKIMREGKAVFISTPL